MPNPGQQINPIKRSTQEQGNLSYDELYDVNVTEIVGEDSETVPTRILRLQLDPTGKLKITGTVTSTPSGTQTVAISQTGTNNDVDATITNTSLAVTGPLTDTQLRLTPIPVSGTVSLNQTGAANDVDVLTMPAITGTVTANAGTNLNTSLLATSAKQDLLLTELQLKADLTETQPVSGPVTDAQLRATPLPVSGTVTSNIGTGNLAGITATVVVKADTAVNQANALKVDGSAVTQPVSGTVGVTGVSTLVEQQTQTTALQLIDDTVATDGAATPTKGILIAGQDGTNAQTIKTDATGELQIDVITMPVTSVTGPLTDAQLRATPVPVSGTGTFATKETRSSTPGQSSPAVGVTNTVILAANVNRLGATIYNEGTVACFVKLGATASLTSYSIKVAVDGYYEVPFNYTGAIDGITASGTATLRVTELT